MKQEIRIISTTEINPWVNLETTFIPENEFDSKLMAAIKALEGYSNLITGLPSLGDSFKQEGLKYKFKVKRVKGLFVYLATLWQLKSACSAFERLGKQKYEELFKK